jgi:mitochondrial fission protein ELM1
MKLDNNQESDALPASAAGCLKGASAWLITDGSAGMRVQAEGVAAALGLDAKIMTVSPRGIWRMMAPWGPVAPGERFGQPGAMFSKPWPDVAIAVGRASIPYIRALKRQAGPACFTIVLQDPRSGPDTADLIWVPEHDRRRGPNVITTVISPHGVTLDRIETLRRNPPPDIDTLPEPRVAVLLGGRTKTYRFGNADEARLETALKQIAGLNASFMVTTSRRTHRDLLRAAEAGTSGAPRVIWRGPEDGENPYPHFLANADWFVVTADSVNMTGEACATGRPVYVFHPTGGSAKFNRFHEGLETAGFARPLPELVNRLDTWTYEPQLTAEVIAREIERRYDRRRAVLPGLTAGRQTAPEGGDTET